jgi:AraC-like DNA-binding protein
MGLVAVLSRDPALRALPVPSGYGPSPESTRTPARLLRVVRELPVVSVIVDSDAVTDGWEAEALIHEVSRRFPSLGIVLIARPTLSPVVLLHLGRQRIGGLRVLRFGELDRGLVPNLVRAAGRGVRSRVMRSVGNQLMASERAVLTTALDAALLGWGADELAAASGWTRAHLGVRLREAKLPPPGRLLLWARLLHAAQWISEPGRTAQSVSRQLGYANGATFRRALRNYLGRTPTQLVAEGGFEVALARFLDVCGLDDSLRLRRSVA